MFVPVNKLKNLKKKLRITPQLAVILIIILFFSGVLLAPTVENEFVVDSDLETELLEEKQMEKIEDASGIEKHEDDIIIEEHIKEEMEDVITENSTFSIRFLDMGQADATIIECDDHYMLIDGGNRDSASKMYAILEDAKIDHLDIVVGTHPDEDHIGGLAGALNYANADIVLCSTTVHDTETFNDFVKYAEKNGGGIIVPQIGYTYELGSSRITILGVNNGIESNDTSIILKIEYGDTSFLFTGDAGVTAEQVVLDSGMDISATVLKVGHHGSSDSTSEAFLNKVMPAYAIISVGSENQYLHPTGETLNRLKKVNAEIYRTDLQGEITLVSDSKTVSITTEKESSNEALMISGEEAAAIAKAQYEAEEKAKAQAEAEAKEKENVSVNTETNNNAESTGITASTGTDYVLNTNSKKFHYPFCGSVKKMKAKNTAYYNGTRDEVIAKGYDPCGNCHP